MNRNIMDKINDLEELRSQISELKQRLDRESTLNEQLLHDSLKMKMTSVHRLVQKVITFGIIGVAAWIIVGMTWHLSPYFIAFTILMLLASTSAEYVINRMKYDEFTTNLKDTVTRLVRMKKMRLRQTIVGGTIIIFIWGPWLVYELSQHLDAREFLPMIIGAAVGFVIGAGIGLNILFKMQRANDEMISQIEEYTK